VGLEREFVLTSTQSITLEPLSTVSSYGAPSYSTSAQTLTAYIEPGARLVKNAQGMEEVATAMIYVMSSSASIGLQDRITLFDGRKPKLLAVDVLNDERGQHHLEVSIS